MKPLVSIIIPVYNIRKYVGKCLESVCGQSYENLEIIVVDDGSTDGSGEICDEFTAKDKRVKIFHKKNGGLSSARNYGIKKAKGDLVALVDGDDWVRRDYVGEMVEAMDGVDMVICGYNDVVPQARVVTGREVVKELLVWQENLEVVAWNKLYRRELFKDIYYPEGEKHEDALTTYKILAKARKVRYVAKSLYVYVMRRGSIMNAAKIEERLAMRERAATEAVKYFKNDEDLKRAAEVAVLTSKYAFIDTALRGEIGAKYFEDNRRWILKHRKQYVGNKYLTRRLKIYNFMITGFWYKIFRRMRHE